MVNISIRKEAFEIGFTGPAQVDTSVHSFINWPVIRDLQPLKMKSHDTNSHIFRCTHLVLNQDSFLNGSCSASVLNFENQILLYKKNDFLRCNA